jgi:hypothetical protein
MEPVAFFYVLKRSHTMAENPNIQDADKVVQDAMNNAEFFQMKDAGQENPVVQRVAENPQPPDTLGAVDNDFQTDDGNYKLPPVNNSTPVKAGQSPQTQEPYFQTSNSVYQNEDELKKGLTAKDEYINELHLRQKTYESIIKTIGTSTNQVQQPAPQPPSELTKEEKETQFEALEEQYGRSGAIVMIAEQIANEKIAARDRQTEQERQETQEYVDQFRRSNPGVSEATVQAVKTRYLELKDTNFNPLDILYNPKVVNQPQGGNGGPINMDDIQKTINAENGQFRQKVNNMRKNFIPRSPHNKSNPVNKIAETRNQLVQKVNAGDFEGALDMAFDVAAATQEQTYGNKRR